jgi:Flp pilus assembly protein TadG
MNRFSKLRRRKGTRGNAVVELALLLPVLTGLFLGTWFFGYSYYLYAELEQAVRAGARFASLRVYDAADPSGYQSAVQNFVVYGDPAGGTQAIVPGLLPAQVTVTRSPAAGAPASVTVSIDGYQLSGPSGAITLRGKPSLQFPFLGNYVPL